MTINLSESDYLQAHELLAKSWDKRTTVMLNSILVLIQNWGK